MTQIKPEDIAHTMTAADKKAVALQGRLHDLPDDQDVEADAQAWLDEGADHAEAFEKAGYMWDLAESMADEPELLALRNETLARVAHQPTPVARPFYRHWGAVAAALLVMFISASFLWSDQARQFLHWAGFTASEQGGQLFQTGVGERLAVTLDDGSVLTLNTASQAQVVYNGAERVIDLKAGQALFAVAKDRSRPFSVRAGNRVITALGTAFDVRLDVNELAVTLLDGKVSVASDKSGKSVELLPGQQYVASTSAALPVVQMADVARVTSWREGQVIFENDTLKTAVAEMNRYAKRPVVLAEPSLEALRISGAFDTGKIAVFVEALTSYFPIQVQDESAEEIVLAARKSG